MDRLPPELLLYVAEHVVNGRDVNSIARLNRYTHAVLNPFLYAKDIKLRKNSSLLWGARKGELGTVRLCLKYGANIHAVEESSQKTLVHEACEGRCGYLNRSDVRPWKLGLSRPGWDAPVHIGIWNSRFGTAKGERSRAWFPETSQKHDEVITFLIANGIDVNATKAKRSPYYGYSALHDAAVTGDPALIQLLLDNGADVHVTDAKNGKQVLAAAAWSGDSETLRLLVERGAELRSRDNSGFVVELWAAHFGFRSVIHELLVNRGIHIDSVYTKDLQTMLHGACDYGSKCSLETVQMLVHRGANVNSTDGYGLTPLWYCLDRLQEYVREDVARFLIKNGADVDHRAEDGTPLLHQLANRGSPFVRMLLEASADIEAKDKKGRTPLHISSSLHNGGETTRVLIEGGANVEAQDNEASSLWSLAVSRSYSQVLEIILQSNANVNFRYWVRTGEHQFQHTPLSHAVQKGDEKAVNLLLGYGADPNSEDGNGERPISWAVKLSETSVLQLLLCQCAEVNFSFTDVELKASGETPLLRAVRIRNILGAKLLLEHGADPNCTSNKGVTPLLLATGCAIPSSRVRFNEPLARLLHEYGADVNFKYPYGWTLISYAIRQSHAEILQFLLANGAEVNFPYTQPTPHGALRRTPLSRAIEIGDRDVISTILKHNVDLELEIGEGRRALSLAIRKGEQRVVEELLAKQCEVNFFYKVHDVNLTPVMHAAVRGNGRIVKLLLDHGAKLDLTDQNGQTAPSDLLERASKLVDALGWA